MDIALEINDLVELVSKGFKVRNAIEKAVALYKATGQRSTCLVQRSDPAIANNECEIVKQSDCASFFGYVIVDSIEYNTIVLKNLNEMIVELQIHYFRQVSLTAYYMTSRCLFNFLDNLGSVDKQQENY